MFFNIKEKSLHLFLLFLPVFLLVYIMGTGGIKAADLPDLIHFQNTYRPVEVELYKVEGTSNEVSNLTASSLPSSWSAWNQSWYNSTTAPIKNQGSTGTCWAFSTTSVAELSWQKEKSETEDDHASVELSPAHLAYFFYNRQNDPLGNTTGDTNNNISSDTWYDLGGNSIFTFQALANWGAFCTEAKAPFSSYASGYDTSLAYDDDLVLENAYIIDTDDKDTIKAAIMEHGALACSYYVSSNTQSYSRSGGSYTWYSYCNKSYGNHAVTLIGWDDSISKSCFSSGSSDPGHGPGSGHGPGQSDTPSSDGAWIIQNSWGSSYKTYYISYEDTSFYSSELFAYDMMPADTYDYNYQYDGTAGCDDYTVTTSQSIANIYNVSSSQGYPQSLEAVGFTTWNDGSTTYDVKVYTGVEDSSPESGTLAAEQTVTTTYAGAYTFPLESPVFLQPGTAYSIVITPVSGSVRFGIDASYTESDSWINFNATLSQGQSFLYTNAVYKWQDVYSSSYCFRIKGFASDTLFPVEEVSLDKSVTLSVGSTKNLTATVTPDKCDDRLTWSSDNEDVATVNADGTVTAVALGNATITATSVADNTKTASCSVIVAPDVVVNAKYTASLTLNDNINVNFTMTDITSGFDKSNLVITVDGEDLDADKITYNNEKNTVTCVLKAVVPKYMGDTISAVVTYDGVTIKSFTYSIRSYCEYVLTHSETYGQVLCDLCQSVLNYGAWADNYFNKKTNSTVNKDYTIEFGSVTMPSPEYTSKIGDTITKASADLTLESEMTLSFNINYTGDTELTNSNVDILAYDTAVDDNNNLKIDGDGEKISSGKIKVEKLTETYNYRISVTNIGASQLGKAYKLVLGNDYIYYGVYNYCDYVVNKSTNTEVYTETLKTLCKAIYNYGEDAKAYTKASAN